MKYTIEDVAKEAGVSITTVSRVINGNYPVKMETKKRVQEIINKLSFEPNPMARSLIRKKTFCIGVVIPHIDFMFLSEVFTGIKKFADFMGYEVFINISNGDAEIERRNINKLVGRHVDGIISIDPIKENIESGFFERISRNIPLVCINGFRNDVNLNYILSEDEIGTATAVEYLISLYHRNIAFVRFENSYSCDKKEIIFTKYMESYKQNPIIIHIKKGDNIHIVENALRAVQNIHKKNYEIGKNITAFFASNDLIATGILHGCTSVGLNVPKDVSVIGFDNLIVSSITYPKLTTVDRNTYMLGEYAIKKLIKLIEKKQLKCENKLIQTKLIIRESCKSLLI